MAAALVKQGKLKEAIERYDEALKINPGDTKARLNREAAQQPMGKFTGTPVSDGGS